MRTTDAAHRAMSDLHEAVAPDLLRYFLRRVSSPEDAADLLAESFYVAWRRKSRLPVDASEQQMWMFGIAHNVLRNGMRAARRQAALAAELRETLALSPEAVHDSGGEERERVRDALATLPADQAELVRLIHWEGFTVIEAARILSVRESTARGRYQRARLTLRVSLAESVGDFSAQVTSKVR